MNELATFPGQGSAVRQRLGALSPLSPAAAAALDAVLAERVRHVDQHGELIRQGENPRVMRFILSGWAHRCKMLNDGRRQIINFLFPGDCCDFGVFILSALDHSIAALTPVTYAEVTQPALEQLTAAHPDLQRALLKETLAQLSFQREWTVNIGQRVAYERMAHLLCEIHARLACVGLAEDGTCAFPVTQTDLADATGLSAVHVNRTLQELRNANLIQLRNRRLTIVDLEGLREIALFDPLYLHLEP